MKQYLTLLFLILFSGNFLIAQDLNDIEGLWRGDKALGDVVIKNDGSGFIVFDGNPDLKMQIQASVKSGKYVISQAEENQVRFYLAFNPFLRKELSFEQAQKLEAEARPMKWVFTLSNNGKKLAGTKHTTGWTMEGGDFTVNNDYSRESSWEKLAGRLPAPQISVSGNRTKTVSIAHPRDEAVIFYSIDGDIPVANQSKQYNSPFPIKDSTTVQAIAVLKGYMSSEVAVKDIIIPEPKQASIVKTKEQWKIEVLRTYWTDEDYVAVEIKATNLNDSPRKYYVTNWYNSAYVDGNTIGDPRLRFGDEADYTGFRGNSVPPNVYIRYTLEFKVAKGTEKFDSLNIGRGWLYFGAVPIPYP